MLIPRALRDLLLSMAAAGTFRPLWQSEIMQEVRRNRIRLDLQQGMTLGAATEQADHAALQMSRAFPDAQLDQDQWLTRVPQMTNDWKDRHVLAAAVGGHASHLVTMNTRDFPALSLPAGLTLTRPDPFLLAQLDEEPALVVGAVRKMARRQTKPAHTVAELVTMLAGSESVGMFGLRLAEVLDALPGDDV